MGGDVRKLGSSLESRKLRVPIRRINKPEWPDCHAGYNSSTSALHRKCVLRQVRVRLIRGISTQLRNMLSWPPLVSRTVLVQLYSYRVIADTTKASTHMPFQVRT